MFGSLHNVILHTVEYIEGESDAKLFTVSEMFSLAKVSHNCTDYFIV